MAAIYSQDSECWLWNCEQPRGPWPASGPLCQFIIVWLTQSQSAVLVLSLSSGLPMSTGVWNDRPGCCSIQTFYYLPLIPIFIWPPANSHDPHWTDEMEAAKEREIPSYFQITLCGCRCPGWWWGRTARRWRAPPHPPSSPGWSSSDSRHPHHSQYPPRHHINCIPGCQVGHTRYLSCNNFQMSVVMFLKGRKSASSPSLGISLSHIIIYLVRHHTKHTRTIKLI